jgi:NAD(P)-dependent dehydrogenase (short-subunit alcohol dehydrogenase family)
MDLRGQLFVVTGGASGIGRACCILISRLSGRVVALDIDSGGLTETLRLLQGDGHVCKSVDLSEIDKAEIGLKEIAASHGRLAGVVHAAGLECIQPLRLLKPARYRLAMTVNAEAALGLVREFQGTGVCLPDGGAIVLVSSVIAQTGTAGGAAYAMSKSALIGLAKSAAIELAPRRIRVNCVAPGFVDTPMYQRLVSRWTTDQRASVEQQHPLGIGSGTDVANAVGFLLSDAGRWITGTVLVVDGGFTAH